MNYEEILSMDAHMVLSILNMKLRDEFSSLDMLCEDFNVSKEKIKDKMKEIGYAYSEEKNQFTVI